MRADGFLVTIGDLLLQMHRFIPLFFIFISCAVPIDYFGNTVDIKKDRIYLTKIREDRSDKDKLHLIFVEQRGDHTKRSERKRQKTLERYIDLIMSYNGYTESNILDMHSRGVIEPRFYVIIQFN